MLKKIDVLFYVEHINRELESVKKIAEELEKKNIRIVSTAFFMGISKLIYSPKVIVVPWSYIDKDVERLVSFLFKNPSIINLHHEQIGNGNTQDYFIPRGIAKNIYHISWGSNYSDLLRRNKVKEGYIKELGSIRMQLTSNIKYTRKELKKTLKKDIDINKKWVLFISSFSWKKIDSGMRDNFIKRGLKHVEDFQKISQESYLKTLEYIEYFLKNNQNIEYIYRLHPSEESDEYLNRLEKLYPNFYLNKDYEVKEWIYNSDCVDLWISTSLNEIVSLNKKFRIIRPIELDSHLEIDYFKKIKKIKTKEDFLNLEYFMEDNKTKARKELEKYYRFDLVPSVEVGKLIKKLIDDDRNIEKIKIKPIKRYYIVVKEVAKDILKILLYYSPLKISRMEKMKKDFFLIKKY